MKIRFSGLCIVFIFFALFKAAAFPSPVLFTGIQGTFAFPITMIEKNSGTFVISAPGGGVDAEFGACIFYEIDKDLIRFFPKFLALRPGAEVALNIYTGENAYTDSLRERGLYEKIRGVVPEYSLIFAVDFPGLLNVDSLAFVPFTSYEAIFSADTRGTVFSQHIGLGLRLFFNKIKNSANINMFEETEQTIIQENIEDGE